ncbi:hypothetical protein IE53DRAFT_130540 [Violaceomyces palustris]|uniref:Uncharacterized protein n=1 Tax=Violaceomyces palustris TaxID=1673888 RepID=A0ACD0NV79_9BASI|nr:hypothetical protein IE53DRAFT_130540 [Violaceomyces palustris]
MDGESDESVAREQPVTLSRECVSDVAAAPLDSAFLPPPPPPPPHLPDFPFFFPVPTSDFMSVGKTRKPLRVRDPTLQRRGGASFPIRESFQGKDRLRETGRGKEEKGGWGGGWEQVSRVR